MGTQAYVSLHKLNESLIKPVLDTTVAFHLSARFASTSPDFSYYILKYHVLDGETDFCFGQRAEEAQMIKICDRERKKGAGREQTSGADLREGTHPSLLFTAQRSWGSSCR